MTEGRTKQDAKIPGTLSQVMESGVSYYVISRTSVFPIIF